jgi:chromosome segregation ATPase
LESEIVELQVKLRSSTEEANQRQNLLIAERKRGEKLEKEIQTYQSDIEKALAHCSNMQLEVDLSAKENSQLQKQLSQLTVTHEKCIKDLELSNIALKKSGLDLIEEKEKHESASLEVKELLHKAKVSHNDQLRLAAEKTQLEKKLSEKNQSINRLKKISDDSKEALIESQTEIKALNHELEAVKSREDRLRRDVSTLEREKDLHLSIIQKSQLKVKEADTEVHKNEQIHLSLEKELLQIKEELKKQQSIIRHLEREIERSGKETADANCACEELKNDLIEKKSVITDLQLQISENEAVSWQLQQDAAKNERLKFSKQAIDDQRQIEELISKIKSLQSEITQLKGEIHTKEVEMAKKVADNQKEHSRNDRHQNDLSHLKKMLQEQVAIVEQRDSELRLLTVTIHRVEEESMVFKKEREQALNERDILASQLVRRNDEIALLYEKIKILQIMMRKGELQYRERLGDIRLLKLKIKDLQREKVTGMKESVAAHQYKKDLIRTNRELIREKLKVKTLSEELENPLNVHRWRRLEGSDPDCYEMIQKIQSLQKRLMQKTEELIQRDIVIQEQEKNNRELQSKLTRQSETDVSVQLAKYHREIYEKVRQVNSLKGELVMYQTKYKEQQENIQRDMDADRHKICSKCKRAEGAKNHSRIVRSCDTEASLQKLNDTTTCPTLKILGGGFVLKS